MKAQRVACLTYHKYPGEDWPEDEFDAYQVTLPSGEQTELKLAERGHCLSNKLWVREIRKLTQKGHQTSLISTAYRTPLIPLAVAMFARWSQENFFKYYREHFGLDKLVDYCTEPVSESTEVVNPEYRQLDSLIKSNQGKLNRLLAKFATLTLDAPIAKCQPTCRIFLKLSKWGLAPKPPRYFCKGNDPDIMPPWYRLRSRWPSRVMGDGSRLLLLHFWIKPLFLIALCFLTMDSVPFQG